MKIELTDEQIEFLIRSVVLSYAEKDSDFKSNDIVDNGPSGRIIGKLVSNLERFEDAYYDARKQRFVTDRVNKNIFMGNGWRSTVAANILHKRLAFALGELSVIERNRDMGTMFDEDLNKRNIKNIKDVLNDIIFAFNLTPKDLMTETDDEF